MRPNKEISLLPKLRNLETLRRQQFETLLEQLSSSTLAAGSLSKQEVQAILA
ncbi:hypothetical protein Egran_00002 [Elaphomyces granulatus]|uniref:Uncharacterized protein n=1 Tax=Elaphomyces granulatus TaxID=519963 RepID=A0A232M823_9EURO|nr:hypothetical protein Egran_00002 [Elaphomyces granulatus]